MACLCDVLCICLKMEHMGQHNYCLQPRSNGKKNSGSMNVTPFVYCLPLPVRSVNTFLLRGTLNGLSMRKWCWWGGCQALFVLAQSFEKKT